MVDEYEYVADLKHFLYFLSLEEKQDSLNRRQKNLLSEWETRKSEVSDWLTDTSVKLKELDANVSNVDAAKDQTLKLQVSTVA